VVFIQQAGPRLFRGPAVRKEVAMVSPLHQATRRPRRYCVLLSTVEGRIHDTREYTTKQEIGDGWCWSVSHWRGARVERESTDV
jgi:hypothetical protein